MEHRVVVWTLLGGLPDLARADRGRSGSSAKHVVFIVKENRSFDQYFGLYPGADGTTTGKKFGGAVVR